MNDTPVKKERNIISASRLCKVLRIKSIRSLQTTKRFPKPILNRDEVVFNADKVAEFFGVDNLDEPFMDSIEAAAFLRTGRQNVHNMASKGILPSYRLKASKGSAFLFKKSELELFISADIEQNVVALNFMHSYDAMSDIARSVLNQVSVKSSRDYKIMDMFLFNRMRISDIAEHVGITKERVRQICEKVIRRMKFQKFYSARDYIQLERQMLAQQKEIATLKELLNLKSNLKEDMATNAAINEFKEMLSKDINDLDLSVRSLNVLGKMGIRTTYELAKLMYLQDGYNELRKQKNIGMKSVNEIKEVIHELVRRLDFQTGFNLVNILRTETADGNRLFLAELDKRISC